MKILNAGSGDIRPSDPSWTNMDNWEGGGHEINEPNFVRHDLRQPLPFDNEVFDGVLLAHCLEHFDVPEGLELLKRLRDALKPGGLLMVSVPDASYFRRVYPEDRNENWPSLFGVTDPANPIPTFFEAALFFDQHKALLTEDSLWCLLVRAGFHPSNIFLGAGETTGAEASSHMAAQLNRREFSLIMSAMK
jgi:predicted SAM-dependent methyltransferase